LIHRKKLAQYGLTAPEAAHKLTCLVKAARKLGASGVALKDDSRGAAIEGLKLRQ